MRDVPGSPPLCGEITILNDGFFTGSTAPRPIFGDKMLRALSVTGWPVTPYFCYMQELSHFKKDTIRIQAHIVRTP